MHAFTVTLMAILSPLALADESTNIPIYSLEMFGTNETYTIPNSTLTISFKETAVDSQNSYYNLSMSYSILGKQTLDPNSRLVAQVVTGFPHNVSEAAANDPGDCSKVFGKDCLQEIQLHDATRIGNVDTIVAFPEGPICKNQIGDLTTLNDTITGKLFPFFYMLTL
jgi:hypothetical protein